MIRETSSQTVKSKIDSITTKLSPPPYLLEGGIVVILAIATIIINFKMIKDGLNGNADIKWHLTWIQHFSKQLSEGILYPRWLAGTNYGYGSPTFVFYPPLAYYFGSFFRLSGLDAQDTLISLFSLALFLSGLTFYLYGRNKWGRIAALMGAFAYITVPYIGFDIYWRGGLGSMFVQAWIPLLWLLTEQSLSSNKKSRLGLAMCWTIIALTHTPSLLICAVIWFPSVLFFLFNKPCKIVLKTILSAVMGLGIASFYLLPAILEKRFVNIETMKELHGGFSGNLLGIQELLGITNNNPISPVVFHQLSVIIVLIILAFIAERSRFFQPQEIWYWIVIAFSITFLISSFSRFIWEASPTLQMLQFPWRFLQVLSFIGAVLLGIFVNMLLKLPLGYRFLLSIVIVGILLMNFRYSYKLSRKYITIRNPGRGNIEHLQHIKTIIDDPYTDKLRDVREYRPLLKNDTSSPPVPVIGQPKISVISGQSEIEIQQWKSYHRIFSVTAEKFSKIRVRIYSYPAWNLYINGKSSPINMSNDGTIELELEPGSYGIELRYQKTQAFILGIILSLLSFTALIFFVRMRII
ncbi:6-pyruvoyl-tetrahydropterin synthase-related protein [Crocosphaera sp.]|uniref:6-pyruvoyl-tetrahydropterin synthase-related protein n=1 Tax=Crocosphaera sp. TaxID=2729996 RepID=UPI002639CA9C|nr:6-pyruvoyl-tetrahydropterin synthase-related protein [Crocosphaera sp.]MDJ0580782.1 6-pyruvoyl-tetrahydropterin synthase-related protein [Crocosphaera sp.]